MLYASVPRNDATTAAAGVMRGGVRPAVAAQSLTSCGMPAPSLPCSQHPPALHFVCFPVSSFDPRMCTMFFFFFSSLPDLLRRMGKVQEQSTASPVPRVSTPHSASRFFFPP